jgi:hypothetical protein
VQFGGSENPPDRRLTPLNRQHSFLMVRVDRGTPALLAAVRSAIRSVIPEILAVWPPTQSPRPSPRQSSFAECGHRHLPVLWPLR